MRGCARSVPPSGPTLQPHGLWPARACPWDYPGKKTGVGCHFLLQGIFPPQGLNLLLLHLLRWQAGSLAPSQPGSPRCGEVPQNALQGSASRIRGSGLDRVFSLELEDECW